MKALVKKYAEPGLWLSDVPEPNYGPGDVLIKVLRTGICGTDLHIRSWDGWAQQSLAATPMVIGHEFVGEVAAVGAGVMGVSVGDLVSGEGHLVCGKSNIVCLVDCWTLENEISWVKQRKEWNGSLKVIWIFFAWEEEWHQIHPCLHH